MHVFPSWSLDYCLKLGWEDFFYWHRRALEIKFGQDIEEIEDGKVDDDVFEARKKRLYDRLNKWETSKQGTISG
jgi:hypothetical protein